MKILRIFFIAVLAFILIASVAVFWVLKTIDVNAYRTQISQQVSHAIGREVEIGKIGFQFSLLNAIVLDLQNLTVADDPQLKAIKIESIHLDLKISDLILKRRVTIANVQVHNGNFIFTDASFNPPMTVSVNQIGFKTKNVSLTEPFSFSAQAALWNVQPNIFIEGSVAAIDVKQSQARLDNLKIRANLSDVDLEQLRKSLASVPDLKMIRKVEGSIDVAISQIVVGAKGLVSLSAMGEWSKGRVAVEGLSVPLDRIDVQWDIRESDIIIKKVFIGVSSGEILMQGQLKGYQAQPHLIFNGTLKQIPVQSLMPAQSPVKVEGLIEGHLTLQGEAPDLTALAQHLKGEGIFNVQEARLKDINVLQTILKSISFIPNLGGEDFAQKVEQSLPDHFKQRLNQRDTEFKKVEFKTHLEDGVLILDSGDVEAEEVKINLNGQLDMSQTLTLNGTVYIPQDLSQFIVSSAEEFSPLLDENQEIRIPLQSYQGPVDKIKMFPDMKYLAQNMMKGTAKEQLKNVIFKALDLGGDENRGDQQNPPSQNSDEHPEKVLIENILDGIFK